MSKPLCQYSDQRYGADAEPYACNNRPWLGGKMCWVHRNKAKGPAKLKPFRRTPLGTVTVSKSDYDAMERDADRIRDEIRRG